MVSPPACIVDAWLSAVDSSAPPAAPCRRARWARSRAARSRSGSPTSSGSRKPPSPPASKGTLVHLALELLMWRPAAERTLEAALADLAPRRPTSSRPTPSSPSSSSPTRSGRSSTPTPRCSCAATSSWRTRASPRARARAASRSQDRDGVHDPRHHRPARARRRRRARRHRLQDRQRARRRLGAAEPGRRAHLLAAVRADVRPPPGARAAALPVEAGEDRHPLDRPVGPRRRAEVGRGDAGRSARAARATTSGRAPRRLCAFCSFREFCPAFGGEPGNAAPGAARPAGRARGPAAAAARARRDRARAREHRIATFDAAVDRACRPGPRSPALDRVVYPLSSAADHSLLWHVVGRARPFRQGRRPRGSGPVLGRDGHRVRAHQRAGEVAVPAGPAGRPTTTVEFRHGLRRPVTSSFPSGHATAAFCAATLLGGGPGWYALAAAVAATRVYVRLHHASDVVAGAALGLALGAGLRRRRSRVG